MKMFRLSAAVVALFLAVSPLAAQQTPNHSIPIGRGGGVIGFGNAAPGTTGIPLISQGAAADPVFGPAANAGIAPGAADTIKGSLNGTTTTDIAVPNCTALGAAIRWAAGVGPNCGTVVGLTGFDMPINLGLSASSNGTALTFNVTQADGSAPTSGNPVVVPFRATPLTLGTVSLGTISAPLSITVPSGATLGATNTVPFRIWIFLDANNGTPALGVATCSNTTNIFPCTAWETTTKTSITIDTASDNAGVLYATTGVSNDRVRIVGYCDFGGGLVTVGTWASACTTLQIMGPGVMKPGAVVQGPLYFSTASTTTCGSATFTVATALTNSITPTSTPNLVRATGNANGASGNGVSLNFQFSRGSSPTLIGNVGVIGAVTGVNANGSVPLLALDAPGVVTATAYTAYCKNGGGSGTFNGSTDHISTMTLEEIQG